MPRVFLLGDIYGDSDSIRECIKSLYTEAVDSEDPVDLVICSPGGDLWTSMAIADAVSAVGLKRPITATITGECCSGAVFALLAATHRVMSHDAMIMVHGLTDGGHLDVSEQEAQLHLNSQLAREQATMFASRTLPNEDYWLPIMKANKPHYYRALEAMEIGLVDEVIM